MARVTREVIREFVSAGSPTAARAGAGGWPCQGIYHTPAGEQPSVALIATHYNVDFSEHYMAEIMADRGYGFLGWNTRYRGNEGYFLLEHALIDIGVGVHWLRQRGVEVVVLLGNSGGGSLMAAYQSQAIEPNIRPAVGLDLPAAVNELEPADLFVSLNAHLGRPDVVTAWSDPSVIDEADPFSADPELDMFNPANGPPYDEAFVASYRAAQEARNRRISAWAVAELQRLADQSYYDRTFELHRTWADLRFADLSLDPSERPAGCYLGDPKAANYSPFGIGRLNTLRTWLSMWSLEHSDCRAGPHLQRLAVPSLVIQSLADTGVFPSDARAIADGIGTDQKELQLIAGDHYLLEPMDARDEAADRIVAWLEQHTT